MKKLIVTTLSAVALIAATASSYGQGQIQFQNNTATSAVTYGSGANQGQRIFGAAGTYEYGLYVGASGATDLSAMTLIATSQNLGATASTSALAGLISGGTVTGQGNVGAANGFAGLVAGNTYSYFVAVWTKADGASYAAAIQANPLDFAGLSALGSIVPAASPSPVVQAFGSGAGQLGAFTIQSAPEPTTLVLGGLGAASLLLFRRRK